MIEGLGWTVERQSPALGAQITGADLSGDIGPEVAETIVALLAEHLVLTFEGQNLSETRHVELGTILGDPFIHPFLEAVPEQPAILKVEKHPEDQHTFGGEYWHADITFMDPPAAASLLYSYDVPPLGGDTLFANQFLAFEQLSAGMQQTLERLRAVHLYPDMVEGEPNSTAIHPVVRTHPVSGRKSIFVNGAFVSRFEGMTTAESKPILQQLFSHQVRPEFCSRVSWSAGQLTIWDNRAVLHYAVNDYPGCRRLLHRVTAMERA